MMPLYANPGSPKERIPSIRQFYADDSECVIAGRKHALLGALELRDPNFVLGRFLKLQRGLRLGPFEEIKWNSSFPPQHRIFITDALLPIFNGCTGFLVIHYNGKQSAAIELCRQLSDYCRSMECDGFGITLDKNIVHDARDFDQKISGIVPGPVAWSAVDSKHNPLIQLADLFVGINKRRIDFGTGHADPNKVIEVEFYEGQKSQLDLSYYFFAGLRYSLWGKVRGLCCDSTRPDHSDPFKHNLGYGLRIFSPLPRGEKLAAVSQFGKEFMGCIH